MIDRLSIAKSHYITGYLVPLAPLGQNCSREEKISGPRVDRLPLEFDAALLKESLEETIESAVGWYRIEPDIHWKH